MLPDVVQEKDGPERGVDGRWSTAIWPGPGSLEKWLEPLRILAAYFFVFDFFGAPRVSQ